MSIVGREWLSRLKFKMVQNPVGGSEIIVVQKNVEHLGAVKKICKQILKIVFEKRKI